MCMYQEKVSKNIFKIKSFTSIKILDHGKKMK